MGWQYLLKAMVIEFYRIFLQSLIMIIIFCKPPGHFKLNNDFGNNINETIQHQNMFCNLLKLSNQTFQFELTNINFIEL